MKILVLNCGSSSVKFQLINMANDTVLARGLVERIGSSEIIFNYTPLSKNKIKEKRPGMYHENALKMVIKELTEGPNAVISDIKDIDAIGHRVVHGGEYFVNSVLINDEVEKKIEECIDLAPLHNPANLKGIKIMRSMLPDVPNVAVFDTAFHQTINDFVYMYALPYEYYEKYKIRRYGFHGTSHRYVALRAAQLMNKPLTELNLITCHLGNGASITAIKNGKSFDTSMGFTPLEGLMMGTRSGDIDPAIILYLMEREKLSTTDMNNILNKKSGLLGVSGVSNDMRLIIDKAEKENHYRSKLSLNIYNYRIKKYIGAYSFALGRVDAIIFTAGVGENDIWVREEILEDLEEFGIKIDKQKNIEFNRKEGEISTADSKVKVFIIPTNEELMIARDTLEIIQKNKIS